MTRINNAINQTPFNFSKLFSFMGHLFDFMRHKPSVKDSVKYSYEKYRKTYELLEKYDRQASNDAGTLADAGRLHPFICELQKKSGKNGRAHSAN